MMAVTQKDTTFTKIFVGGLPYHTTDESLREFFKQFGDIDEAVVITDRQTAKSRGYGFVTMSDKAAADRACKDPNPIIDGRKANVNLAYLGAKPRSLPLALKAGVPGLIPSQFGMPQLVYAQSSNPYITNTAAAAGVLPVAQQTAMSHQQSAAVAASAGQMIDYGGYPAAAGIPNMASYEAMAAQYAASQYMAPVTAAAYTYSVPQPLGLAAATHYQPQQIQERMQ